ncbi:MAG: Gfo/Idh/MocA family oxidoreductase [Eubacteriales bacterium]|nr:Gfo/Idh/MocA family oxidoreductase [Eubacteriales bacterium]
MKRVRAAVVGCGCISGIYLTNLTTRFSDVVEVAMVCDIIPERALEAQKTYNIHKAVFTDEEVMADPTIEVVLNITPPLEHKKVNMMALAAGKHAFCEKPLACTLADGREQAALAQEKGLLLGGAPDTFLGGGIQTCKKLIEDGWIGTPVAATAQMLSHGPESWHPDPEFFYKFGAGPLFDMGPYYVTALINLLGGVKNVAASARASYPQRVIGSEKKKGQVIDVEVPTHCAGILNFASGAIGTLVTSFDVWNRGGQPITVYGSAGTIRVPDPNTFGGPIELLRAGSGEWEQVPVVYPHTENSRGLGFTDFCRCIRTGEEPLAGWKQTLHVLEVMCAFYASSETGENIAIESAYPRRNAVALNK